MSELNLEHLWVAAALAALILPAISALTTEKGSGNFAKRWMICWIANITLFCLVLLGFVFEGLVNYATGKSDLIFSDPYSPFHLNWWQKGRIYLSSQLSIQGLASMEPLAAIALLSLIISWVTLFGRNRRQWAIFGCRSAFLAYVTFDIILAIVSDSSILELMKELVFDLIGAILFGAAASVLIDLIFNARWLGRQRVESIG